MLVYIQSSENAFLFEDHTAGEFVKGRPWGVLFATIRKGMSGTTHGVEKQKLSDYLGVVGHARYVGVGIKKCGEFCVLNRKLSHLGKELNDGVLCPPRCQ